MTRRRVQRRLVRGRVYGPGPAPRLVLEQTGPGDSGVRMRIQDPDAERASAIRLSADDADALAADLQLRAALLRGDPPPVPDPRDPPTGPLAAQRDTTPGGSP